MKTNQLVGLVISAAIIASAVAFYFSHPSPSSSDANPAIPLVGNGPPTQAAALGNTQPALSSPTQASNSPVTSTKGSTVIVSGTVTTGATDPTLFPLTFGPDDVQFSGDSSSASQVSLVGIDCQWQPPQIRLAFQIPAGLSGHVAFVTKVFARTGPGSAISHMEMDFMVNNGAVMMDPVVKLLDRPSTWKIQWSNQSGASAGENLPATANIQPAQQTPPAATAITSDESAKSDSSGVATPSTWPDEHFPQTRSQYMSETDIANWQFKDVRYAINEMYARHGYVFKTGYLNQQFSQFSWYHPTPGLSMSDIENQMTDIERANLKLLSARRDYLRQTGQGQ